MHGSCQDNIGCCQRQNQSLQAFIPMAGCLRLGAIFPHQHIARRNIKTRQTQRLITVLVKQKTLSWLTFHFTKGGGAIYNVNIFKLCCERPWMWVKVTEAGTNVQSLTGAIIVQLQRPCLSECQSHVKHNEHDVWTMLHSFALVNHDYKVWTGFTEKMQLVIHFSDIPLCVCVCVRP